MTVWSGTTGLALRIQSPGSHAGADGGREDGEKQRQTSGMVLWVLGPRRQYGQYQYFRIEEAAVTLGVIVLSICLLANAATNP